jgi:hypothetical protein
VRNWIDLLEAPQRDGRFQYHLSTEPNLIPMRSFAEQSRTNSQAGARGEAGGEGIYTTHALAYWITQLAYEDVDEFPRYCYLVWVRNGGAPSSIDSAHQDLSPPSDVIVLSLLDDLGTGDDMPDIGRIEWRADKWIAQHGADDALTEGKTLTLDINREKATRCLINPSHAELLGIAGSPERWEEIIQRGTTGLILRGMITPLEFGNDAIWWSANGGIHLTICKALGILGGTSSDEDRRYKMFVNIEDGAPVLACHQSQLDHPWVKRMATKGMVVRDFSR